MEKFFLYFKRLLALILCGFFGILSLDWIVGIFAFCIGSSYRGAFFPEVWGFVQNLFTWMPEHTITRFFMGLLVALLTFAIPIIISCLSFNWFSSLLFPKKKNEREVSEREVSEKEIG